MNAPRARFIICLALLALGTSEVVHAGPGSAAGKLADFDDELRSIATIDLELPRSADDRARALAERAESAWNGGRFDEAVALVRTLEESGTPVDFGVAWLRPRPSHGLGPTGEARIGGPRVLGLDVRVDADGPDLFAVVRWRADDLDISHWTANGSSDGGATWSELYAFASSEEVIAVDANTVGGYLYVSYVSGAAPNEARMRRFTTADGAVDAAYGSLVVFDASPSTIVDVATAANRDDFDDRIYPMAIQADHAFRFAWASAAAGTPFVENPTGTGVTNAVAGLSAEWSTGLGCPHFLFASYRGTDDRLYIIGHRGADAWDQLWSDGAPAETLTSISAYEGTVICAFEPSYSSVRYWISYNCGTSWSFQDFVPDPIGFWFGDPSVTARGGQGTAIAYWHHIGHPTDPNPLFFHSRSGYAPDRGRPGEP